MIRELVLIANMPGNILSNAIELLSIFSSCPKLRLLILMTTEETIPLLEMWRLGHSKITYLSKITCHVATIRDWIWILKGQISAL